LTCHHNIYELENIHIRKDDIDYEAEWLREYSDVSKDIATLRVKDCPIQPLECAKEARPKLEVDVWGFPSAGSDIFPKGRTIEGRLGKTLIPLHWQGQESGDNEWNVKPEVNVDVFQIEAKTEQGFSGGPVSYTEDNVVVGMFEARDDNFGYLIPIQIILDIFKPERNAPPVARNIDSSYMILMGDMYSQKGEHERAIFWYNQVIHDRNLSAAHNNIGLEFDRLQKYNDAIYHFDKAIEVDPLAPEPWLNMGITLRKLHKYTKSIKCYKRAVDMDPNYVKAWSNMGHVYFILKRYQKAIANFRKAIQIDPAFVDGWFNIGISLFEMKRFRKAQSFFEKARELDPEDTEADHYIKKCHTAANS